VGPFPRVDGEADDGEGGEGENHLEEGQRRDVVLRREAAREDDVDCERARAPEEEERRSQRADLDAGEEGETRRREPGSDPAAHADAVAEDECGEDGRQRNEETGDESGARDRRLGEPEGLERVAGRKEDAEQKPGAIPRRSSRRRRMANGIPRVAVETANRHARKRKIG
jgi:hypothetical protein